MPQNSYQKIVLVEDLILTWPSSFNGGPVVNDINDVEVIVPSSKIILPDATLVTPGQSFIFNNISGIPFQLLVSDGTTVLATIESGEVFQFYLVDDATTNGTWRIINPLSSFNGIVELTAESNDGSIIISGSPVTPPSGVLDFKLPTSITNLNNLNSTDFLVVTNKSPLTFQTVELLGGLNITISNGSGIAGNPVIDLNSEITGITSFTVGDLTLSGDTITNDNVNGNIVLTTTGTGTIQLNGVTIGAGGTISGLTNFTGASAFCVFTDTIVGLSNQIVIQQQTNVSSITGSAGTYVIHFITPMTTLNYGVFITLGSTGGSLPFISNSYFIVRELTYVTIIVTDASGELVLSAPHGVSVMIMGN